MRRYNPFCLRHVFSRPAGNVLVKSFLTNILCQYIYIVIHYKEALLWYFYLSWFWNLFCINGSIFVETFLEKLSLASMNILPERYLLSLRKMARNVSSVGRILASWNADKCLNSSYFLYWVLYFVNLCLGNMPCCQMFR